ncbi:uncharacterized protein LOC119302219 isoform X2 [Triticum dicoccoides]|uniref:uncharacterized protein LOC119302219 isoform X2 n=1 Tax=Triticum dicoccoides TaxID=85692 RepID=UPI0018903CA1|nr:uncharacterized protein LOC119302219 isoform X2 [Triticum dicoccoides]
MCVGHNSRMLKLSAVTTHTTKHSYCMKSRSYVVEAAAAAAAAANRSLGHGRAAAMGRRGGEQRLSEAVRIWVYKGIDLAEIKKEFQNIPRRMPLPQSIKLYYRTVCCWLVCAVLLLSSIDQDTESGEVLVISWSIMRC